MLLETQEEHKQMLPSQTFVQLGPKDIRTQQCHPLSLKDILHFRHQEPTASAKSVPCNNWTPVHAKKFPQQSESWSQSVVWRSMTPLILCMAEASINTQSSRANHPHTWEKTHKNKSPKGGNMCILYKRLIRSCILLWKNRNSTAKNKAILVIASVCAELPLLSSIRYPQLICALKIV